ncbi:MAG: sigma-54-dependent Fis family transcriptional regulator [Deltaproteobacteria bacterium]|nr:sigma-54-dependent Fis family transcriptional regulator [Deltaproteobacteria bacterium]
MHESHVIEKNIEILPVLYLTKTMKQLYKQGQGLDRRRSSSVLIVGESGTGRELLAKSLHYTAEQNAPFVTINCVNLPLDHYENKIEKCFSVFEDVSEPMNPQAATTRPTLFMRDIGKLDVDFQTDLFSLLKHRMQQYNEKRKRRSELVSLMFSYNNNGIEASSKRRTNDCLTGMFKPFLLNILPLRDRRSDVQPLATFFIDKFSKEYGKDIGGIHSKALKRMDNHTWPGNVSELRDVIENAVLLAQGPLITKEDIRFNISKKSIALESFLNREDFFTLNELETVYINTVLRRLTNNKSKAAKILGISRNTLQRRLDAIKTVAPKKKSRKKSGNQPPLF